ncbi:penicillin-binding protein activator [Chelatococcus albus]
MAGHLLRAVGAALLAGGLAAACSSGFSGFPGTDAGPETRAPATPAPGGSPTGAVLGNGRVKVALILPLGATGQAGTAAVALRNAAELALEEFKEPDLQILVKDDRGTSEGARAAAQGAVAEGAELVVGPLFAGAVQAAGQVAHGAGRPVIAFSTDVSVAGRGTYLLSFLPETEVRRIVGHAAREGRRSFAALVPESPYGRVAEAAFREAVTSNGGRVVAVERYGAAGAQEAAGRIAGLAARASPQIDALFLPDSGDGLVAAAQALQGAGIDPKQVKMLGTGLWNEARVFKLPALQGGWFAAPDSAGFNAFAQRYRARFNADPTRIATLSYDAISLAAALVRTQGERRFSEAVLTNPSGFAGADGVFRFRPDGTNERALAVLEVRNGNAVTLSPAPRQFGASGT